MGTSIFTNNIHRLPFNSPIPPPNSTIPPPRPSLLQSFPRKPLSQIHSISTRPGRKSSPRPDTAELMELVDNVMRNFTDKKPLVSTLSKYVRVLRMEHCFLLFEELGKTDSWLQCLEVFRWMQKQRWYVADNGVYSKLISVMGRKGQTRMAMWLFSEMRNSGCRPDTSVYNSLITAHLHSRDKVKALDKALGYFNKMKETERCKPSIVTYNILLRAFAQARKVGQVDILFKDLEESIITPDVFTFNGVMDAYGKNGMIREMESVLARMKSNQCRPDLISFNLLIDAYGKKQEFDKMEQVFKSLLRSRDKPTPATFNSMITNYGKARRRENAEHVFERLKELGHSPNYITYESVIMMYGACDCVSKARDVFDGMVASRKEVRISTLHAMLDAYCMNGLPTEADSLFDSASSLGFRPNTSTYKLLYKAYTKANQKELLQKLLARMDREGIVPNKGFFLEALGAFGSSKAETKSAKDDPSMSTARSSKAKTKSPKDEPSMPAVGSSKAHNAEPLKDDPTIAPTVWSSRAKSVDDDPSIQPVVANPL